MSSNNPFDFKQFFDQLDPEKFASQFQEMFSSSPFAGIDLEALADSQRKNVEAMLAANEAYMAGARNLMEKQSAMMQETLNEASRALNAMAASDPAEALGKNAQAVEQSVKKSMENFGEIATMMQQTYTEMSEKVEQRMQENLEELKQSLAGKQ